MKIREIIVVEGKHDTQKLQSFFDVDTIETNGLHLSKNKIKQIEKINAVRGVILFLDPDSAGSRIRQRLNDAIPNLKNAFIDKKKCRTTKKVGIEHASKEDLEEALKNCITFNVEIAPTLSYEEFSSLGFHGQNNSRELRIKIGNLLFLGECNGKTLYKRLNMFQITKEELVELIEGKDE